MCISSEIYLRHQRPQETNIKKWHRKRLYIYFKNDLEESGKTKLRAKATLHKRVSFSTLFQVNNFESETLPE